jgi:hypothetical protein
MDTKAKVNAAALLVTQMFFDKTCYSAICILARKHKRTVLAVSCDHPHQPIQKTFRVRAADPTIQGMVDKFARIPRHEAAGIATPRADQRSGPQRGAGIHLYTMNRPVVARAMGEYSDILSADQSGRRGQTGNPALPGL